MHYRGSLKYFQTFMITDFTLELRFFCEITLVHKKAETKSSTTNFRMIKTHLERFL